MARDTRDVPDSTVPGETCTNPLQLARLWTRADRKGHVLGVAGGRDAARGGHLGTPVSCS